MLTLLNSLYSTIAIKLPGGTTINPPSPIPPDPGVAIQGLLVGSVTLLLIVALLFSFFFIVMGGIQFIMSSGDKAAIQRGRDHVTWAVLGLIVTLMAFVLVKVIGNLFGVTFF